MRRKCLFVCCLALLVAECAALVQKPDEVRIKVGTVDETRKSAAYSDIFLPYLLIADQTYRDNVYNLPHRADIEDFQYCYLGQPERFCDPRYDGTRYARDVLKAWRVIYASKDVKDFPCDPRRPLCTEPVPGLGVQIWVRNDCSEAVIAFRGTDGGNLDDWKSNLHFLLRLSPLYDQYRQVYDHTPRFVEIVAGDRCFRHGRPNIVVAGHSLGGGLAQHATFRDSAIRRAVTFDPSFVTAMLDVDPAEWTRNVQGLQIERAYERGEILALPRLIVSEFVPLTACNPQIRTIGFNALSGNPIQQHSLGRMAKAMLQWSRDPLPPDLPRREKQLPGPRPGDCTMPGLI
jgi:hypothetical protein